MQIKVFQASGDDNIVKLEAKINAWVANLPPTDKLQLQVSAAITDTSMLGWTVPYVVVVISYSNAPAPTAEANETMGT